MKKYLMFTLAAALGLTMANAQKLSAAQVPAAVKNSFAKAYPNQAVKWEKEKGQFINGILVQKNLCRSAFFGCLHR